MLLLPVKAGETRSSEKDRIEFYAWLEEKERINKARLYGQDQEEEATSPKIPKPQVGLDQMQNGHLNNPSNEIDSPDEIDAEVSSPDRNYDMSDSHLQPEILESDEER